jgi:putative ABC transport system permease protein
METLLQDFRYAIRALRKSPAFTTTIVLALGLGIGATTVIVSAFDHVVLRPLAYPDAGRLVVLRETIQELKKDYPSLGGNASHYLEWKRECASCQAIGALRARDFTLTGSGETEQINAVRMSGNLFSVLGAAPQVGTTFASADDREVGNRVVVLSDAFWRRRFGADPSLVGQSILLDNEQWQVIGVLPRGFHLPHWRQVGGLIPERVDLVMPLALTQREATTVGEYDYGVIAKVRAGQAPVRVQLELDAVERRLSQQDRAGMTFTTMVVPLQEQVVGAASRALAILLAAVAAVLAIVCVNVGSLVLARSLSRSREAAVRVALGAGQARLVRQTLAEGTILGVTGGAVGVLLASWGFSTVLAFAPPGLPRLEEITLDLRVLLIALGLSLITGLSVGIVPALRAARSDPGETLKAGGRSVTGDRRSRRAGSGLISAQVGLTSVLLIGAGLLISSFVRVLQVDKGFAGDRVLAADITLPAGAYDQLERRTAFYDEALNRLSGLPGVRSAALTTKVPLEGETQVDVVSFENDPRPVAARPMANILYVSPGYFETLGIVVRGGRSFSEADRGRPVVMLSNETARTLWERAEVALGKQVVPGSNDPLAEVIGVTTDVRNSTLERRASLIAYLPYWQRPPQNATLVLRSDADPSALAGAVRQTLREIGPAVPVQSVRTMSEVISTSLSVRRFQFFLLGLFALSALLTAAVGIYGIISQSLSRRTGELGIRLAMGATPGDLRRLVLREGLTPVATGILGGIITAVGAGQLIASLLFEVSARDPFTISVVTGLILLVTALACWIPARRASQMDPVAALRNE